MILLDPIQGTIQESRATEDQAIGRAYRQGQKQSVVVVRYVFQPHLSSRNPTCQSRHEQGPILALPSVFVPLKTSPVHKHKQYF